MPLPIAHGLFGASIVAAIYPAPTAKRYCLPLLIGAFLANCPDLDFFIVWLLNSRAWHRAFTHSLLFSFIFGTVLLLLLGKSRIKEVIAYGLAFMSHGILDYVTTKEGGGIELLWFVSRERLKLGLVGISELPSRLSILEIIMAVAKEIVVFTPLFFIVLMMRRRLEGRG